MLIMDISVGTTVYDGENNEYKILEIVGSGGFGNVFKAKLLPTSDEILAVKTFRTSFPNKKDYDSFLNEANLSTKINHRNVIKYYFFHDDTLFPELPYYFIMEFADGGSLKDFIKNREASEKFFSNEELISMFSQLIDGMEAINKEILHRDIKPENILVKNNVFKISDFGIGRAKEESTRNTTFLGFGSEKYKSPEAWNNKVSDQMDIYSMGIVFFELATLNHPFEYLEVPQEELKNAHLNIIPPKPEIINKELSLNLSQIIIKMLNKKPDNRYKKWEDIKKALNKKISPSAISTFVEKFIRKELERENTVKKAKLEEEKKRKEKETKIELIQSHILNTVINPLEEFIKNINSNLENNKIQYNKEIDSFTIQGNSEKRFSLSFIPINEEDFYKNVEKERYSRKIIVKELDAPKLDDKSVLAWGGFTIGIFEETIGHNILLIENNIYGDLYILTTTNSVGMKEKRLPEPFFLNKSQLEKTLRNLSRRLSDRYHTEIKQFEIDFIFDFIVEHLI